MLLNQFNTIYHFDMTYSNRAFQQLTLTDTTKSAPNIHQYVLFISTNQIERKEISSIRIIIALKAFCQSTFYGRQCSVQCIPNDDCTSSYTCHPQTGEKICASGWFGSDCSKHNLLAQCSSSGD